MIIDYPKADSTFKMQQIKMQLEQFLYCQIKLKIAQSDHIHKISLFWLSICKDHDIIPNNNFASDFLIYQEESILKFAPENTYKNMTEKSLRELEKFGIPRTLLENILK